MQFKVFGQNGRNLTRGAAILMVGALSAGCSSSVSRFDDFTDGLFTGSTENQRQIIGGAENQPFPGDAAASAPVNGVSPQPVMRSTATQAAGSGPVQRSTLAPMNSASAPALDRMPTGATAPNLLPAPTRATARPAVASANEIAPPQTPKLKEPGGVTMSARPQGASGGYTIVAGDTLFGIAKKTGASAAALRQANGLSDGVLRIGQTLTIPASASQMASAAPARVDPAATGAVSKTAKPRAATSAEPAAYTPPAKKQKLVEQVALDPSEKAPDATGIGRMRWPVRGRVVTGFGDSSGGKSNDGIDIAVPEGTAVKAAENGVVIYAGDGLKEYGNTVLVRHENGLVTVYGHASEIKVTRGDTVKRGQEIASSGMSGSAETPKLHFEVRKDSAPVDPSTFLE